MILYRDPRLPLAARIGAWNWRRGRRGIRYLRSGINYIALALHAVSLSRRGVLDAELAGVDVWRELRRYSYLQFWIIVPLLMAVLSVSQARRP